MTARGVGPAARRATRALVFWTVIALPGAWDTGGIAADSGQAATLRRSLESLVVFELTQPTSPTASTADQVTLVFSDRLVEGVSAPLPLFGEDVLAEFSFSGHDFREGRLRFARRVRDLSFLGARYLRIVNHGGGAWQGRTLSITVDGAPVLRSVPLTPLRGPGTAGGVQNWNARNWRTRRYWEIELQRATASRK